MLTAHVVSSVGWLGAVAVFLSLGVVGLASQDAQVVRGVYLAMEPAGWSVLVPLSLASLSTGLVHARSTKWGLFRHCWVLMKFAINLVATVVLLMYMQTLDYLADIAAARTSLSALRDRPPWCTPASASCCCLWPQRCRCTCPGA